MAESGEPILLSLYVYAPINGAPIFFAVAYGLSAVFHIWQCSRYHAWALMNLHCFCAILFTVGYALREYGVYNYLFSFTSDVPLILYVLSQVFIYICPPLLELSNYRVLGRVFYYVPYLAPLPPGSVLKIFGGLMVLVETLNAVGISLAANPKSKPTTQSLGNNLTIAALAIQLVVIAIFVTLAGTFHWRYRKAGLSGGGSGRAVVKTMLRVLYASMVLIFLRCIYRLVEHTGNTTIDVQDLDRLRALSPILRYEAFFYVFEATLMLVNSWIWNVWHPSRFLPKDYHVYLARDGTETMDETESEEDNRPLLAKTANVLTFGIFFGAKKGNKGPHHPGQELSEYPPASSKSV